MEQIFAGWFPGTLKDIVPGDCKCFVKMCNTWIIIIIIIIKHQGSTLVTIDSDNYIKKLDNFLSNQSKF